MIGAHDPTEVTYDCCGGDNAISETITAPITCDDTECGRATGPLTATREDCEDFETPVEVTLEGICSHGRTLTASVSVSLVKQGDEDSVSGCDAGGQTSTAGVTESVSSYSNETTPSRSQTKVASPRRQARYIPKGAPTWHITLGGNSSGAFSGRLELVPSRLFNPNLRRLDSSILKLTGSANNGLDIVHPIVKRVELNNNHVIFTYSADQFRFKGIKSHDGYAVFSSPTNFPFSISFCRNADICDEYDEDGNYVLHDGAQPYAVYEIGYGNTNLHAQAYSLRIKRPNAADETIELYCDDGTDGSVTYGISRGNGAWTRELTAHPADANGVRMVVERIKGEGDYERVVTEEYRNLNGKDVLLTRTQAAGTETRRDVYAYYENGKRKSHLSASGLLTEYAYDDDGRRTLVRETLPDGRIVETRNSYVPLGVRPHAPESDVGIADDDGSVDFGTPRVETRYENGVPVSKTLRFIALDTMNHRIVEEIRLLNPATTNLSAEWNSPANVRTYTDYMPYDRCKPCSKRPSLVINADGTVDHYAYSAGDCIPGANGTAGVYTDSGCGVGDFFRTIVTHCAAHGAIVPNMTTRDVTVEIRSSKKPVLQERYVSTGTGLDDFARIAWTATTRDTLGNETLIVKSDGSRIEKTYAGRRLASMTDTEGMVTTYAYDSLGRVVAETKSFGGNRPDTVIATAYDPEGRVLSRTVSSGGLSETESHAYDAFGRTRQTIDASGSVTRRLYETDAATGFETTTTIRAFGTSCAVTNKTISYADGRTKETRLNGMVKTTYEYGPNWTKTDEGPKGLASPRWSLDREDALGRTIATIRPGFNGALLVSSNEYNTANQLVATRTYVSHGDSALSPLDFTCFCYNSLVGRNLTVNDMNRNGQIDWNDTDRIVSNDVRFVSLDGAWWRETSTWQARQNGSSALTCVSLARDRLTGLGLAGTAGVLTAETRTFDVLGNETVMRTYRDRASRTTIRRADTSDSNIDEVETILSGQTVSLRSRTGEMTLFEYDALGREIARTDGHGNRSQTVYDAQGRVAKTIDALGAETTYGYDALGRRTSIVNPLGATITTAYDAENRVVSERGATYPVDYAYDAYGNKISMTTYRNENLASGDTTRWFYDEASLCMTNKVYADGKGPAYTYTPDGKLARRIWARGIVTDYTYDNAGQLVATVYSDMTPTITMAYDRVGNLTRAITDGIVTNLYAYNLSGHCTNEWQNGFQLTRHYDALGRSLGYDVNGVRQSTLAYDAQGRFSSMQIADASSDSFAWSYLANSDLKQSLSYPNGLTASWSYDANNRLVQVRNAIATNIISQFDYVYDAAGRRTSIARSGSAFGDLSSAVDAYQYNTRNELIGAQRTKGGQPVLGFSEDFDYDLIGNRQSSSTYNERGDAQTSTYQANNLNQYVSRTTPGFAAVRGEANPDATVTVNGNPTFRLGAYYFGSDNFDNTSSGGFAELETYAALAQTNSDGEEDDDLVSSVTNQVYLAQSPETFAYDEDGNQTLISTKTGLWRVTYNGENRPVRWVRDSDGAVITMSYDHMGRRRTKNGRSFYYDGYLQIADNAGNAYVWDPTEPTATRPLAWMHGETISYYTHDGNKNVSEVITENGTVAAHYEYAPFGATILQRGDSSSTNPWRFSSEYAEDDTVTVYYNYRHYEPVMGRWLSRDLIEESGGVNLYAICDNNPVLKYDLVGAYTLKDAEKSLATQGVKKLGRGWLGAKYSDKQIFDEWLKLETTRGEWWKDLPKCPKKILIKNGVPQNPNPAVWELEDSFINRQILKRYHKGAVMDLRTKKNEQNKKQQNYSYGNQCVYDECGKLITEIPSAGTADYYSPNNDRSNHYQHDVKPFEMAEKLNRVKDYYSVRPSWNE